MSFKHVSFALFPPFSLQIVSLEVAGEGDSIYMEHAHPLSHKVQYLALIKISIWVDHPNFPHWVVFG